MLLPTLLNDPSLLRNPFSGCGFLWKGIPEPAQAGKLATRVVHRAMTVFPSPQDGIWYLGYYLDERNIFEVRHS